MLKNLLMDIIEENCELQGTDNVQGQTSGILFQLNRGYCVYYPSYKIVFLPFSPALLLVVFVWLLNCNPPFVLLICQFYLGCKRTIFINNNIFELNLTYFTMRNNIDSRGKILYLFIL